MTFTITPVTSSIISQISSIITNQNIDTSQIEVFENIAYKIAAIQNTKFPLITKPTHFIIAADHGVSINEFFDLNKSTNKELNAILNESSIMHSLNTGSILTIKIVNAGLKTKPPSNTEIINYSIKLGTSNYCETTAMSFTEYEEGIKNGSKLTLRAFNEGCNCISFGTISNESPLSASLVTAEITSNTIEKCLYFNDEIPKNKQQLITKKIKEAKSLHSPMTLADIMCAYGGFDTITIVGGMLKAAELKMTILVDSFVSASALLFAYQLNENIIDYCIFSNQSNHKGHQKIIDYFEKKTILNLDFGSNLGLGVPISLPIIKGALNWLATSLK